MHEPRGLRSHRADIRAASHALLAQLVEHFHGKEGVVGSSPTEGSLAICSCFAYSNGVRHVKISDPDGNAIALAEPPDIA